MQKIPGVSLYHQIKQDLRVKIEPLDPGTKIETEQQLSDHYGVSRGTTVSYTHLTLPTKA